VSDSSPVKWATVVLAAGGSERWGGRPKALLPVGPERAVERVVRLAHQASSGPVVVVAGSASEELAGVLRRLPAQVVWNDRWVDGRTGSVQRGVAEVHPSSDVLLWPVDHPFVEAKTLAVLALVEERDAVAAWFIPTFQGSAGHPVLWRAPVSRLVLELRASQPLRAMLPRLGPQVRRVNVADPGVVENDDTPEAYHRALERFRNAEAGA
jgi:molybdenum cofactor cytidylyltransferase